ncbi:MAG TPA: Gmad2 immunoglobulin-like domain-containing protein [Acidimicrobiales bacterium]|nr:Gmad2 immunoglobulin-like domain-containing protein [Acidimicrobiales bacterium]
MSTDDRLRRALRARADRVEPGHDSWAAIQSGVAAAQRRRRFRTAGWAGLAVAAMAAVAFVAVPMIGDDPTSVETGPVATSPTSGVEVPPPATGEPTGERFDGIWPFTTREAAARYEPGVGPGDGFHGSAEVDYTDPEATAVDFARTYLGFPDPVVEEGFEGPWSVPVGERETSEAGGVVLRSQPDSPLKTTVGMRRLDQGGWFVTGARAASIPEVRVTTTVFFTAGDRAAVDREVTATGTSTAFEGTIQLEVRQHGMGAGESLGATFTTGGSMGELGPFEATFTIERPTAPGGALVVFTDSAKDGTVQEATVVRMTFDDGEVAGVDDDDVPGSDPSATTVPANEASCPASDAAVTSDQMVVEVFFTCEEPGEVAVTLRAVPASPGVLRASLDALLAGPTADERADGFSSWFSEETAGALLGVTVADGRAVVDLDPSLPDLIPNASTSAGSAALLAELNATVFQFGTVDEVEYRLGGSCDAFFEWLQSSCTIITRADAA